MSSREVFKKKVNFLDILPKEWIDKDGKISVIESVYVCLFFSPADMDPPFLSGKIDDVIYMVVQTEFEYSKLETEFKGLNDHGIPSIEVKINKKNTPPGTYIIFFTRYREGGVITEGEALSKLESARGLIDAIEGLSATYLHVFDQVVVLPDGPISIVSPVMLNPASLSRPFLDIEKVSRVATSLSELEPELRNRILLALRWIDKSDRDIDPTNSFLKTWFAIEVIAMPDSTNIRPAVELLAEIYGKSYEESCNYFQLGRIASLRSDIVHNGVVRSIHQQLHKYLQAIFADVLLHLVGQPSEKRTEEVLNDNYFQHHLWRP